MNQHRSNLCIVLVACSLLVGCGGRKASTPSTDGEPNAGPNTPTQPTPTSKIVGKWRVIADHTRKMPRGATLDLQANGKAVLMARVAGTPLKVEGTYQHRAGTFLLIMVGLDGKEHTESNQIVELSDRKFVYLRKGKRVELAK